MTETPYEDTDRVKSGNLLFVFKKGTPVVWGCWKDGRYYEPKEFDEDMANRAHAISSQRRYRI